MVNETTKTLVETDETVHGFSKAGYTRNDYRCNAVPGHSTCRKRIASKRCPSFDSDERSDIMCHGHSHNANADIGNAINIINEKKKADAEAEADSYDKMLPPGKEPGQIATLRNTP